MSTALTAPQQANRYRLNVYEAINQVQLAMSRDGIGKSRKNEQQGYSFRGIDDMYNALSIPLASFGLCIIPRFRNRTLTERTTQKGSVLFYVTVEGEFDLVGPDGSKHTAVAFGEAMDSADKATKKAMSAAFKYMCMQLFCIPTEGDNDADSTTHELQARADAVAQRRIKELSAAASEINRVTTPAATIIELADSLGQTPEPPLMAPDVRKPPKKAVSNMTDAAKKRWLQAKLQLRAVRDDKDKFYYAAIAPYKHCTEIPTKEEAEAIWKVLQSGLAPNSSAADKALLLEVEAHQLRIGPYATQAALDRRGLRSIEEVLTIPNGDELDAFLRELRETA